MRFKISTYFVYKNTFAHRCEVKTNEISKAFEIAKAFTIGSKSCNFFVWNNKNKSKLPNYGIKFSISELEEGGILQDITNFEKFVLAK